LVSLTDPRLCEKSARYKCTLNFDGCGHAESKTTQKFVLRTALRPNQIRFSHSLDPKPKSLPAGSPSRIAKRHGRNRITLP
jgi:hypothetical protein